MVPGEGLLAGRGGAGVVMKALLINGVVMNGVVMNGVVMDGVAVQREAKSAVNQNLFQEPGSG